jgi:hypothetical protein
MNLPMEDTLKPQIPNSRIQIPNKDQIPKSKYQTSDNNWKNLIGNHIDKACIECMCLNHWDLDFVWNLDSGIWNLRFQSVFNR